MKLWHHLYSDLDEWCTGFYMETHFTPFAVWVLLYGCLFSVSVAYSKLKTGVQHSNKDTYTTLHA